VYIDCRESYETQWCEDRLTDGKQLRNGDPPLPYSINYNYTVPISIDCNPMSAGAVTCRFDLRNYECHDKPSSSMKESPSAPSSREDDHASCRPDLTVNQGNGGVIYVNPYTPSFSHSTLQGGPKVPTLSCNQWPPIHPCCDHLIMRPTTMPPSSSSTPVVHDEL
jgi:hypothetical protein